jgi:hypothetical protein
MALVECKGCGGAISNKAKSCPKCGEPNSPSGCLVYLLDMFGILAGILFGLAGFALVLWFLWRYAT